MRAAVGRARGRLRALALSLESSLASPEAAQRWASEQPRRPDGLRRAVTTTLIQKAVAHPKLTGRVIRRTLPDDLEYLGVGYHSVVYRSADGKVLKVNRRSIHVSDERRAQIAAAERRAHDVVERYLGDLAIPQEISVGPHPAAPRLRAVIITQAYCTYTDLDDVFVDGHDRVDATAVHDLVRETPAAAASLRLLARRGLDMADQEGLVPDVCGRGNLGFVGPSPGRLMLIDRQPMKTTNKHARNIVIPQLGDLLDVLGQSSAADDRAGERGEVTPQGVRARCARA